MNITITDVQSWLREFNATATPNEKKRELQLRLHNFQANYDNAWQICLHYLAAHSGSGNMLTGTDQYLWLFAVSTVELAITRHWCSGSLQLSDRLAIRNYLWHTYMNHPASASRLERSKLAQLIALIGKREFPDHHPGFVNEVLELMRRNFLSGVVLLHAISAEVVNTKEDLTVEQKKYFQSSLNACLPEVFDVINKAMAIIVCKQLKTDVSEIPVEFKDLRLLRALPDPASNDAQYTRICAELLECLQQLFAWVPLAECLGEFLLNTLFLLARWCPATAANVDVATGAMAALSELFYRQAAIPHAHLVANGVMQLLQEERELKDAPELYQDKLTELLRLFTTQHASRWIDDDTFPSLLWHLFRFTFQSYGALAFTERLLVWVPIIKGLLQTGGGFRQYTELLMALLNGILEKMQFQHDQTETLEALDTSTLDDDLETEWQHYLTQCIEVVALVAEGQPEQVLEVIVAAWRVPFEVFFVVEKAVINGDWHVEAGGCLAARGCRDDAAKAQFVHCILRDLSSLCQTFSRLAPLLERCSERVCELVRAVAVSLVLTVKFLATKKPHLVAVGGERQRSFLFSEELRGDFVETFAQTLSALKGIMPWAQQLSIGEHLTSLVDVVAPLLLLQPATGRREPQLVRLAAANLLLAITQWLRPVEFVEQPGVAHLMHVGIALCHGGGGGGEEEEEHRQVAVTFYKAVCNSLLLPWHAVVVGDQRYEERAKRLEEFLVHNLSAQLMSGCHAVAVAGQQQLDGRFVAVVEVTLGTLRDILEHFVDATTTMKQMLVRPLKQVIEAVLQVFKLAPAMGAAATNAIFAFLFSCIQVVQLQLGNQYIKDMLGVLLTATLASSGTMGGGRGGGQSVEKLLQILCLIVKSSHGSVQQVLLPSILELALDHIVPHLGQHEEGSKWAQETDITTAIFTLFDGILLNHWQYFYKGGVLRKLKQCNGGGMNGGGGGGAEDLQHQERFMAIMRLYGHALVAGNDPHIMTIVLQSLQKLDDQWKLYHKEVFQTHLLAQFQYALIGALMSPEGALCYDQMINTLYTMGQVNMKRLHEAFYMFGFSADNKLVQEICLATDLPTFSYQMAQLIQDTRLNAGKGPPLNHQHQHHNHHAGGQQHSTAVDVMASTRKTI